MEPLRVILARCSSSLRETAVSPPTQRLLVHMNDMFFNLFPNFVVCGTRLVAVAAQKFIADIADIAATYYTLHCSFAGDFA